MGTEPGVTRTSGHGLKANAIGFVDALVIGLASTAPAYSLAAVIGLVVVLVGVQAPAVLLAFLFVRSVIDLSDPEASYSGGSVLGLGVPLVIGGLFLLLGAVLMIVWRLGHPTGYFRRRGFEAVAPEIAAGRARPAEEL